MYLQRAAAIAIVAGFGFLILGFAVGSSGVCQAPDIESALQAMREQRAVYTLSGVISGLAIVLPPVGFLLLARRLRSTQNPWPINLGVGLLLLRRPGAGMAPIQQQASA